MAITAIDLTILIELVEKELYSLHTQIDNPAIPERERDDCAEMSVVISVVAGHLQDEYELKRTEGSTLPDYEELIKDIESRIPYRDISSNTEAERNTRADPVA